MTVAEETPTDALLDGRYRLIERVGAGGSGEVHRAEDVILGRTVAVKVLHGEHESFLGGDRVRRETEVLAALNHPSIVTLHDAQLAPGRTQYLVMEYVEGRTLAQELARGAMEPAHVALLAHDLAEALGVLHARGIVHRDVKPSNVLLGAASRRGEPWTAKLADFGIAHVLDDPRMTAPGMLVGTAAYMAPEQVSDGEVGPASDVYALGLVLREALTGEPAYPLSGGLQTALARLSAPPRIPVGLGPDWSLLLTRMTRTDPAERPTAAEMVVAATALLAGRAAAAQEQVVAVPSDALVTEVLAGEDAAGAGAATGATKVMPRAGSREASPTRRRRGLVLGLLGLIAVALAALGGVWAASAPGEADDAVRAVQSSFTKVAPPPVVSEDDGPAEDPGDGKGQKGKDEGNSGKGEENSGKKDDED